MALLESIRGPEDIRRLGRDQLQPLADEVRRRLIDVVSQTGGRIDRLPTLRQPGGLSGFLRRSESPHDQFGAGHAGTGLSAAYGIAAARDLVGEQFKVVAV